jgi:hypothetical protein
MATSIERVLLHQALMDIYKVCCLIKEMQGI